MISFILALVPLLLVLVGIVYFRQSGAKMAIIGWLVSLFLACAYFKTSLGVALGASAFGVIKAMGISVAVVFTMLMIFVMKEAGALSVIANAIKRIAKNREEQAMFIGMGFGSFVTALGAVTPALFPPLLMAIGFGPFSAVSIAVLGYDPLTSFALLSIPVTLPADASSSMLGPAAAFTAQEFAFKIAIFLPVVSVGLAFAMLWIIGGRAAMRRGLAPAIIAGLVISLSALVFVIVGVPVRIVGVLAGLMAMLSLLIYHKYIKSKKELVEKNLEPIDRKKLARAFSPWLLLIIFAVIISIPFIGKALADLPGSIEVITVFANQRVDLDVFNQIYFWILIALLASLPILKPTKEQLGKAFKTWTRRIWEPFIAYSVYFSIAYVMFFSAMVVSTTSGRLIPSTFYHSYNMDVVVGGTLAAVFGMGFIFIAASLGLFGAVVGGSETASNIMFMKIQHQASLDIGLNHDQFMTMYGSHAAGGGIASAMTPAKINNAVATIDSPKTLESRVMRKHMVIAITLTIIVGIMTGIFIGLTF
jgi:lactate permease